MRILFLALACMIAGCAELPHRPDLAVTAATPDYAQTRLGSIAAANLHDSDKSGFQLMPVASNAYLTRIELCNASQATLDVQYYLLAADNSGKNLLRCLAAAAHRGVRVRLLLDDYYTAGEDALLTAFAGTPNVEVRLFNPFPAWRNSSKGRFVAAAADFSRIDHRMHNKLFLADNALAVAGGRNLADEYFMGAADNNFIDMDVLAAGPIVRDLSKIFDTYWNSEYVYPLQTILGASLPPAAAEAQFERETSGAVLPRAEHDLEPRLLPFIGTPEDIASGKLHLTLAYATAYADPVDKVTGKYVQSRRGTLRDQVGAAMRSAQVSVTVLSPYFVPGELGMEAMEDLSRRGVQLTLITNSLASTDEPLAHGAYVRSRVPMLRLGVAIYELSPELGSASDHLGRFGASRARLHAKMAIIDHARIFVGSMNLDERSESLNTELGIFIDSPELARQFENMTAVTGGAYRLTLSDDGESVRWIRGVGPSEIILDEEPETSLWLRFKVRILSDLVPPSEL